MAGMESLQVRDQNMAGTFKYKSSRIAQYLFCTNYVPDFFSTGEHYPHASNSSTPDVATVYESSKRRGVPEAARRGVPEAARRDGPRLHPEHRRKKD